MVRGLLYRLAGLLGIGDGEREKRGQQSDLEEGKGEEKQEFVPSRLDASVLEAHGMETTRAERELDELQEQAEQLEEQDREG